MNGKLAETEELPLDLGAEHNAEEKGENEAVSEKVVVELDEQIDKVEDMKVVVIKSEPKAELETDLESQEGATLYSVETDPDNYPR